MKRFFIFSAVFGFSILLGIATHHPIALGCIGFILGILFAFADQIDSSPSRGSGGSDGGFFDGGGDGGGD